MAAAPWVVSDELWSRIEPLVPKVERRFRYPGRKRLPDRQALQGILFVLYTGIAWRHRAGVWERLHEILLAELRAAGEIEWSRAGRGLQPRAGEKGGSETGPSPVDRARSGSKHHLLVDATGIPLAWIVTGGNRNDVTQLVPLVERIPPVRGKVGRPRRRPDRVTADRGYDHASTGASSFLALA
jgi:transposase